MSSVQQGAPTGSTLRITRAGDVVVGSVVVAVFVTDDGVVAVAVFVTDDGVVAGAVVDAVGVVVVGVAVIVAMIAGVVLVGVVVLGRLLLELAPKTVDLPLHADNASAVASTAALRTRGREDRIGSFSYPCQIKARIA